MKKLISFIVALLVYGILTLMMCYGFFVSTTIN